MSDAPEGPDWWQASDGRWYAGHLHPDRAGAGAAGSPAAVTAAETEAAGQHRPGWWQASDGQFYPPHLHPDRLAAQAAPATGWRAAHTGTRDDLIRTAVVKPPLRSRVSVDRGRFKGIALVAVAVLVVAGAGIGIASAIGGSGGSPSKTGSKTATSLVVPTTTVASRPITAASAVSLDLTLSDFPTGWAGVEAAIAPRQHLQPSGNCSFGRTPMLWEAVSGTFANKASASADQFAFDQVIVTDDPHGALAALEFASSSTYQQTCLHPVLLDAVQPYTSDQTITKCSQPLTYAGDQIATANEYYASAPAFTTHWVGWYECPTNQQLDYFYVDEIVMQTGRSAVAAYWIGLTAEPSSSVEATAMRDISQRAAANGL